MFVFVPSSFSRLKPIIKITNVKTSQARTWISFRRVVAASSNHSRRLLFSLSLSSPLMTSLHYSISNRTSPNTGPAASASSSKGASIAAEANPSLRVRNKSPAAAKVASHPSSPSYSSSSATRFGTGSGNGMMLTKRSPSQSRANDSGTVAHVRPTPSTTNIRQNQQQQSSSSQILRQYPQYASGGFQMASSLSRNSSQNANSKRTLDESFKKQLALGESTSEIIYQLESEGKTALLRPLDNNNSNNNENNSYMQQQILANRSSSNNYSYKSNTANEYYTQHQQQQQQQQPYYRTVASPSPPPSHSVFASSRNGSTQGVETNSVLERKGVVGLKNLGNTVNTQLFF